MQNKLQELTDKLYNEGLSKGKQEGEAVLANARVQAAEIVENAKKEAAGIVAAARKEAENIRSKADGDLKIAAGQSIEATKQAIENLVVCNLTQKEVSSALTSAAFVKELLTAVVKAYSASSEAEGLDAVLPETLKKETGPFIKKELASMLKGGLNVTYSKKISGGFTISPKGSGYFISFTDETFNSLISEYLRPATKKILFEK